MTVPVRTSSPDTGALVFTVPGEARGKGRPRLSTRGGFARGYTDAKTASYENLVKLAALEALAGRPPLDEAVSMSVTVRIVPPASASKRARAAMLEGLVYPAKKPDIDNCIKAVMDGLNTVAFRDDALVVSLTASKIYAERPGVDVRLEPMERRAA